MAGTIFWNRGRPEQGEDYAAWAGKTRELAVQMPGFVSQKSFVAKDGERLSVVECESEETHTRWREYPDYLEARKPGRERFYPEYQVQACRPFSSDRFPEPRCSNGIGNPVCLARAGGSSLQVSEDRLNSFQ